MVEKWCSRSDPIARIASKQVSGQSYERRELNQKPLTHLNQKDQFTISVAVSCRVPLPDLDEGDDNQDSIESKRETL